MGFTGDDALLSQMIGNLLDNAIHHAGADGRVIASLERSNGHVRLRITNDGPGMRQQIAIAFSTASSASAPPTVLVWAPDCEMDR